MVKKIINEKKIEVYYLPSMLKIVEKLPLCHITLVAFKHNFTCVSNERPYNKEIVKALHKNVIVLYCHVL